MNSLESNKNIWISICVAIVIVTTIVFGFKFLNVIQINLQTTPDKENKNLTNIEIQIKNRSQKPIRYIEAMLSVPKEIKIKSLQSKTTIYNFEEGKQIGKDTTNINKGETLTIKATLETNDINPPKDKKSIILINKYLKQNKPIKKNLNFIKGTEDLQSQLTITLIEEKNTSKKIQWITNENLVSQGNSQLKHEIKILNKKVNPNDITWQVEGTDINGIGNIVKFKTPSIEGEYTLKATYKKDTISKDITILSKETIQEIENNKEPLVSIVKEDKKEDTIYQSISKTLENEDKTIELNVVGEAKAIDSINLTNYKSDYIENIPGVIGKTIKIERTDYINHIEKIELEYNYNIEEVKNKGIKTTNICFYEIDIQNMELNKIPTNQEDNKIKATIKNDGIYLVADSQSVPTDIYNIDLVFNLDYSPSMKDNDLDNKRIDVSKNIIDSLYSKNYRFGIVKFYEGTENLMKLDENVNKEKISDIFEKNKNLKSGTDIENAIYKGVDIFGDYKVTGTTDLTEKENAEEKEKEKERRKIMILLTDGDDNKMYDAKENNNKEDFEKSRNNIIEAARYAKENNVQIYTVGLGSGVDAKLLKDIAIITNGKYIPVDKADSLVDEFKNIQKEIEVPTDIMVDKDKESKEINENIAYKIADSGFRANKDGFKFENFSSENVGGTCHGLAAVSALNYAENIMKDTDMFPNEVKKNPNENYEKNSEVNGYKVNDTDMKKKTISQDLKESIEGTINLKYYSVRKNSNGKIQFNLNDEGKKHYIEGLGYPNKIEKVFENKVYVVYGYTKLLDVDKLSTDKHKKLTNTDIEMLKTLTWWWSEQDSNYRKDIIDIEYLKENINYRPYTIGFFFNRNNERLGHSVVAQSLWQDAKDNNKYYLEVYDNNYPEVDMYIEISDDNGELNFKNDIYHKGEKGDYFIYDIFTQREDIDKKFY